MTDIPDRHVEFAKAVGALARQYKMTRFSGTFRPGYGDDWRSDINFVWDAGRHEEDVGKIYLNSTVTVHTTIPK